MGASLGGATKAVPRVLEEGAGLKRGFALHPWLPSPLGGQVRGAGCFGVSPAQAPPCKGDLILRPLWRAPAAARVGSALGRSQLCFCPPGEGQKGVGTGRRCCQQQEEDEDEEEEEGAGEQLWQQGLPHAQRSSKFLKGPQPLFQGLC